MEANYLNSPSPSFFTIPIEFDDMLMESLMDFNVDDQESIIPLGTLPPLSQTQETIQEEDEDDQLTKSSLIDLLILGAEAVEADNFARATTITGTLHRLLLDQENNLNNALHRLAYYFTVGLHLRTSSRSEWCRHDQQGTDVSLEDMTASQMVQELTPYVKFAHFTANQAILEAMDGQKELHIIDMDVMEGIQWPPLMADLSRTMINGVSLRIIALVWDGNNLKSIQRTGRRLLEFAKSIGFALRFDTILVDNEEDHHFDSIEVDSGILVLNCMVYNTRLKRLKSVKKFLDGSVLKRLCPKMVVMVEEEVFSFVMRMPCMSFVDFFCEALQHFTCVYDSLVSGFGERYKDGLRVVEKEMLGPRIVDYVGEFERGFMWTNKVLEEGFKCIPLSVCNVSQAKFLVGVFSGGYGVEHVKGGLALSWKSRPLINVTVWVPSSKLIN